MNFDYQNMEAVHIKVKKIGDTNSACEFRKFSVDPQITSYNVLHCLLSRAFDLHDDFAIHYQVVSGTGDTESYLPLLSDLDLDCAFASASDPCLTLSLSLSPSATESGLSCSAAPAAQQQLQQLRQPAAAPAAAAAAGGHSPALDITQLRKPSVDFLIHSLTPSSASLRSSALGGIFSQMQSTWSLVFRSLTVSDEQRSPLAPPLGDGQFQNYLDSVGRLVQPKEMRVAVFRSGVEPTLRKVVWKHLLNVYPDGMSGSERFDYIRRKCGEYKRLRDVWMYSLEQKPKLSESDVLRCTSMVKKDVLRTDRHVPFFAGCDDNASIVSLFNLLTTYAVHHPSVGYVQGMSDLASPLLYVMRNEAQAYICFCALMLRLRPNFTADGVAMTTKFEHLATTLRFYDPELFAYLKERQADDLLFCYRWLLLELKREFAFDDTLHMLEVLWSSLQPSHPERSSGLPLQEPAPAVSAQSAKVATNGFQLCRRSPTVVFDRVSVWRRCYSSDSDHSPVSTPCAVPSSASPAPGQRSGPVRGRQSASAAAVARRCFSEHDQRSVLTCGSADAVDKCDLDTSGGGGVVRIADLAAFNRLTITTSNSQSAHCTTAPSQSARCTTAPSQSARCTSSAIGHSAVNTSLASNQPDGSSALVADPPAEVALLPPPPQRMADGNPFLVFLCLALLRQQRAPILERRLDYQEIGMLFDRLVRQQDLRLTLRHARAMFADYLKHDWSRAP